MAFLKDQALPVGFAVVGMAGILDTSRMNLFLAQELDVCPTDVKSLVLGSHGDSMVQQKKNLFLKDHHAFDL